MGGASWDVLPAVTPHREAVPWAGDDNEDEEGRGGGGHDAMMVSSTSAEGRSTALDAGGGKDVVAVWWR